MAAFFGIDELNAQDFIDKGIACIPHTADGKLDLHAVVSPIRNKDIVFIKHCTTDSSLHIKAVGVVQSEYLIERNRGACVPVTWVWQGDTVPVNVDEMPAICGEQIYEEHNIMVQRQIVDLLRDDSSWSMRDKTDVPGSPRA